MKVVRWAIYIVFSVILAGAAFLYFSPSYNMYVVRSGSMTPAIDTGDVIITGPVNGPFSKKIVPGTIITYKNPSIGTITHRVYSISGNTIATKGDAVEDVDPWKVTMSEVQGVYLFRIPRLGFATTFIQTKVGWIVTIIIPATILVLWLVKDIVKEAFSQA